LTTTLRRALVLALLIAVALAPAVARAHLRVSAHATPAQENARFRWSNSCEQVPSRLAADNHVASVLVVPFAVSTDSAPRRYSWPEIEVVRLVSLDVASPGLRAPPSFNL
jgi:hypothetical protein